MGLLRNFFSNDTSLLLMRKCILIMFTFCCFFTNKNDILQTNCSSNIIGTNSEYYRNNVFKIHTYRKYVAYVSACSLLKSKKKNRQGRVIIHCLKMYYCKQNTIHLLKYHWNHHNIFLLNYLSISFLYKIISFIIHYL